MQTQSTLNRWAIVDETREYTTAPEGPVEKRIVLAVRQSSTNYLTL